MKEEKIDKWGLKKVYGNKAESKNNTLKSSMNNKDLITQKQSILTKLDNMTRKEIDEEIYCANCELNGVVYKRKKNEIGFWHGNDWCCNKCYRGHLELELYRINLNTK